ncbi:hypothetical protein PMAYCL1PPCAC_03261, partial [Pristionchus mayeri]
AWSRASILCLFPFLRVNRTDGGGDFLGALHSESEVTVVVSDSDEGLDADALPGPGLLLDENVLESLILQIGAEVVDD